MYRIEMNSDNIWFCVRHRQNVTVTCDVFMESLKAGGSYKVTNDLAGQTVLAEGRSGTGAHVWHTLSLTVQGQSASGTLDGTPLWKNVVVPTPKNGWAAIGTRSFELAQFDNFAVSAE
ncbi:galactocerebrosidase-like [Odontesthes bonariensis]|uniref:galactocerebrosidase-like n=1 Tax=Odontesthes bonariensis TaxID=219752 RepID=UPI003F58046E